GSFFFFSSRRRHTRWPRDWSSDVCSSDLMEEVLLNVMYELPSRQDVTRCLVDRDVVLTGVNPTLVPRDQQSAKKRGERQERTARSEERRVGKECRAGRSA